ncbi:ARM repeat-containing protein [Atractiella rhizophila]|nr:ARM repeat-containing protein [Atractiella rhizophila]
MSLAPSLEAWHAPSTRSDLISTLINSVDRYNPNNVGILEAYLLEQLKGTTQYDALANLAILKLYQFNPELSSTEVILNILLLTLSSNPFSPDFSLALSLLSSISPPLAPLPPLSSHLQARHFPQFWAYLRSEECTGVRSGYMEDIEGFEKGVRKNILKEIEGTFSRISSSRLARWLGLEESDAKISELTEELSWTKDGEWYNIPENQWNTVVVSTGGGKREEIKSEQIARLVAAGGRKL